MYAKVVSGKRNQHNSKHTDCREPLVFFIRGYCHSAEDRCCGCGMSAREGISGCGGNRIACRHNPRVTDPRTVDAGGKFYQLIDAERQTHRGNGIQPAALVHCPVDKQYGKNQISCRKRGDKLHKRRPRIIDSGSEILQKQKITDIQTFGIIVGGIRRCAFRLYR